ncbi:type II toxin-antitoxin system mRNA interferase toxin YoeB [Olivibacter ginsenosidimutans]|uniref:Putative mRNA interferase YoeB n=1 Tax=Olivibacter ginsenosidimutans TaxID=1176537 RepID=A0ABP9C0N9_9SPHI
MKKIFLDGGWEDYLHWQNTDKSLLKKINGLLKEIEGTSYAGSGKPEPLKYNLSGWWSRRITLEHRLIYRIDNDSIIILQCRYHY